VVWEGEQHAEIDDVPGFSSRPGARQLFLLAPPISKLFLSPSSEEVVLGGRNRGHRRQVLVAGLNEPADLGLL